MLFLTETQQQRKSALCSMIQQADQCPCKSFAGLRFVLNVTSQRSCQSAPLSETGAPANTTD
jgi:hypothetical protein